MTSFVLALRSENPLNETVGDLLRDAGTTGIWEMSDREWRAYFEREPESLVPALLGLDAGISAAWEAAPAVDWAARYQESLRPIPVGRRFAILPSPDLANPWPDRLVLSLVPGMAFGTGDHFTTASCLQMLEEFPRVPRSLFDLGCGTGILAAAAWKLGTRRVLASDIDPEACAVSRETAAVNGTPFEIALGSADVTDERFECVLANILAETLIELFPAVRERVLEGGSLIGSGILLARGGAVLKAASDQGFSLIKRRTDGEWWTFLWTRN